MLIGVAAQYRTTGELIRTKIWGLLEPYVKALEAQGAAVVVIPPQAQPRLLELAPARHAAEHGVPLLGICRGIQVLNAAPGGSLHQDLPAQGFKAVQSPGCWGTAWSRPRPLPPVLPPPGPQGPGPRPAERRRRA